MHPLPLRRSSLTNTSKSELARRDFVFRISSDTARSEGFAPYASDAVLLLANAARLSSSVDRGRIVAHLKPQVSEGSASYAFAPISDSLAVFTISGGSWPASPDAAR